ncbi:hypothetical protein Tco_0664726, partial [Tanacetum coccineum]
MASMNNRLNIEKLDGNIVKNHGGSKQVEFKQLGPGVETGVHGVHDEKCIWFKVELQGAQGDREAEVFQVSNDDTAVAQRWLEDKQPEEKTNTDSLVKEQEKEYQTGWKIKTDNSGLSKIFWAEDTTMSTYLVTRSPSSAIGFKTPIDMLGFFGWLASIKQGMLGPVKVVLYRNTGFNESGEYKKTFIGSGVGTGSMQVLQVEEFDVEPQDDHTFEVEPHGNVNHVVGSQEVQTQDLIYYHPARDREQHSLEARSIRWSARDLTKHLQMWACLISLIIDYRHTYMFLWILTTPWVDQSQAAYMTLIGAWKKEIWLKGLLAESGYELSLVAGIATGALVKGSSRSEVPAQVEGAAYRNEDLGIEASYSRLRTPAFEDLGDSFMVDLSSYMEESVEFE